MNFWRILCLFGHHRHCTSHEGGLKCDDCGAIFSAATIQAEYQVGAIVIGGSE